MANEIAKLTADLNIIAKLDDEPNDVGGLSAAELKAEFDKAGLAIQKYINETLLPNVDEISDSFMLVRVTGEAPGLVADKTAKEINDFAAAGGLPVMVIGDTASAIYYNPKRYPGAAPFVAVIGQTAPGEREGTMQTIVLTVRMDKSVDVQSYDHNTSAKAHMDIRALITRNQQSLKLLTDFIDGHILDQENPHGVTYQQVGADPAGAADAAQAAAISAAMGDVVVADCFDAAEPSTSAPNTWYVPKTSPRPSGKPGMTIDVRWKNGRMDGLGYDVSLIWGAPNGPDNETIVGPSSAADGLSGEYSIPAEGTVRYQLEEQNGRKHWRYVSGKLLPKQFSSATAADVADKAVPGMEIEYLPGMEAYIQLDNGNTADVMRLVPDNGPTLPAYGNGTGAKTGDIPAGYILHLVNAGDHWQVINGGSTGNSGGGVTPEQLNEPRHTTMVVTALQEGGGGYKADRTSTEIINHANAGGIVVLRYAGTDGRTLEIRMSGQTKTREALFFQTFKVPGANKVRRVDAKVDYAGNMIVTDETIDVATAEQFNQLNTQKADLVDGKVPADQLPEGMGGLSTEEKALMIDIFRDVKFYKTPETAGKIDRLEELWNGGTPVVQWTITRSLSNCATDNVSATIADGTRYGATITANKGYTLDGGTVKITMAGADITSDVYTSGRIDIPTVTGDLNISVAAIEIPTAGVVDLSDKFTLPGEWYWGVIPSEQTNGLRKDPELIGTDFIPIAPARIYTLTAVYSNDVTYCVALWSDKAPQTEYAQSLKFNTASKTEEIMVDGIARSKMTFTWDSNKFKNGYLTFCTINGTESMCSLTYEEVQE